MKKSKTHRRVTFDDFLAALQSYLPAGVIPRLEPHKQRWTTEEGTSEADSRDKHFEAVLGTIGVDLDQLLAWGETYRSAIFETRDDEEADWLDRVATPPDEPQGVWDKLLAVARDPGPNGKAASLLIFTLALARAVRVLKGPASRENAPN
jgi:hypothetical protein